MRVAIDLAGDIAGLGVRFACRHLALARMSETLGIFSLEKREKKKRSSFAYASAKRRQNLTTYWYNVTS
jgi:hypothetical protein